MAARALAADLEHDLDRGRLTLFYQPQFNDQGEIIGVEALLRWQHELYGYIDPPIAIALAEESGFFQRLDQWILDRACQQMHTLLAEGITGITLSINTTAPQLEGGAVYAGIQAALARYGIPPESLEIEITEKDALLASHATVERMKEIRALGVRLAMDDFGMGHTSLLYLKEYIFDTVKIDGSLVTGLMSNPVCSEIIGSIVMLGKSLSFSVLAEFVETEAQRDRLRQLGCRQYQGYLYQQTPSRGSLGWVHRGLATAGGRPGGWRGHCPPYPPGSIGSILGPAGDPAATRHFVPGIEPHRLVRGIPEQRRRGQDKALDGGWHAEERSGSTVVKMAPPSGWLAAKILPPWAPAIQAAMASPSPDPVRSVRGREAWT